MLADIYRGVIPYWDDPHYQALNPTLKLPHEKITVVHRSDGSGTSFIYTSYLSEMGPTWASQVGASDSVELADRHRRQGQRRRRRAGAPDQRRDRLRRVRLRQAEPHGLRPAAEQGRPLGCADAEAFAAAAAGAKWSAAPGFYLLLINQPGANAWPISGATFILMHNKQTNAEAGHNVLAFFDWAYKNGNPAAASLDYVALPEPVKALIRKSWGTIQGPNGKPVYP